MKIFALIPARYNSTRFPGKLMQLLGTETVIYSTYKATVQAAIFDKVYVVTDSEIIYNEIMDKGGNVMMSAEQHECGTDRIAAAALSLDDADVIVNVQGDEPFINQAALSAIVHTFKQDTKAQIQAVSLMQVLTEKAAIENPNNVKVVVDHHQQAALFSRSVIPYLRDANFTPTYYKHIGIYAFRKEVLIHFATLIPGPLELAEKLEGNRFIENNIPLKMLLTAHTAIGIDTEEDLKEANQLLASGH
jgi:3-deoxy-manno-octulosonate cytidylyltransferase (CMP-KDO synthetase)